MKAAVLRGPNDLRIEEVARPEPGPGEVLVRMEAALTGGTVRKIVRRGYHARLGPAPVRLGHEGAGVVETVGEGVEAFAPGDRVVPANSAACDACAACGRGLSAQCADMVWLTGFLAEALLVPARIVQRNLHRVPDGLDAVAAALAENLAAVLKGHDRSPVRRGERALVIGAGALGLLWTRVLALRGAHVTAVDRREDRAGIARSLGAEAFLSAGAFESGAGARAGPWDLVVEAVGTVETWEAAVAAAAPGGRVHLFGGPPRDTRAALDTQRMHYDELLLVSSFHHTPYHFAEALRLLAGGFVDPDLLVPERLALADLPAFLGRHFEGGGPIKAAVVA